MCTDRDVGATPVLIEGNDDVRATIKQINDAKKCDRKRRALDRCVC